MTHKIKGCLAFWTYLLIQHLGPTVAYLHTCSTLSKVISQKHHGTTMFTKISGESDEHVQKYSSTEASVQPKIFDRIREGCYNIGKRMKPVALAVFTSTLVTRAPMNIFHQSAIHPPAAHASAPLVPVKRFKPPNQKEEALNRMKAQQDEEKLKAAMAHRVKLEEIEAEFGTEARVEYEKKYEAEKARQAQDKAVKRKELMYNLALKGICPFVDVEGVRQMYLFDRGIDLSQIPASPQNKEAKIIAKYPNLARQRTKQRFIVKCVVDDLILKGKDPLPFLMTHSESTSRILNMPDQELDPLIEKYTQLIQTRRSISGVIAEKPFDVASEIFGKAATPQIQMSDKQKQQEKKNKEKLEKKSVRALEKKKKEEAKKAEQVNREMEKQRKVEEKKMKEELKKQEIANKLAASKIQDEIEDEVIDEDDYEDEFEEEVEEDEESENDVTPEIALTSENQRDSSPTTKASKNAFIPIASVVGIGAGAYIIKVVKEKSREAEEERNRQFQLIMGLNEKGSKNNSPKRLDEVKEDEEEEEEDDDLMQIGDTHEQRNDPISIDKKEITSEATPPISPAPLETPKQRLRIGGITSVFSKKSSSNRETDLKKLLSPDAVAPKFAMLLTKLLTYGAPGRFPSVSALPGGMPMDAFDLDVARDMLMNARNDDDLTNVEAAEFFASVVNCMIIDIIELASSSLGVKEKKEKATVDALNVVLDFMDHAASLYDAVAESVVIKPVVYGGTLSKSKLEDMFSIYAASMLTDVDGKITQSRVDTLQLVFNINDKRAEGLVQKATMKNLMNMMKNGGEGMEGMEGLSSMLAGLGNEGGGFPGLGGEGDLKPEDLKQSITMMKDLIESGSVSKEEIDLVRKQFKETYGSDISDLIAAAESGDSDEFGEDSQELIDLFKTILKDK